MALERVLGITVKVLALDWVAEACWGEQVSGTHGEFRFFELMELSA